MADYNQYLQAAMEMARKAGDIHLEYFRTSHLDMHTKLNDSDVVTAADKAAEDYIKTTIHQRFPDHGIIAEESGVENADHEWRWVVDPSTVPPISVRACRYSAALLHWSTLARLS